MSLQVGTDVRIIDTEHVGTVIEIQEDVFYPIHVYVPAYRYSLHFNMAELVEVA